MGNESLIFCLILRIIGLYDSKKKKISSFCNISRNKNKLVRHINLNKTPCRTFSYLNLIRYLKKQAEKDAAAKAAQEEEERAKVAEFQSPEIQHKAFRTQKDVAEQSNKENEKREGKKKTKLNHTKYNTE